MSTNSGDGSRIVQDAMRHRMRKHQALPRAATARFWRSCIGLLPGLAAVVLGATAAHAAIPASERAVLQNIYDYTDGPHWYDGIASFTPWNSAPGTECQWQGIVCNEQGTSVITVNLRTRGLDGPLPSLAGLTNLERLDVSNNSLRGPIPPLDGLIKLKTFVADQRASYPFSGSIPSLQGLVNLETFVCIACGVSGNIPSLSGLTSLKIFDVSENQLSGPIPSLSGLTNLSFFNAYSNLLDGPLPDLSGLENLEEFGASRNFFSGGIPDLVGLPKLYGYSVSGVLNGHIGLISDLPNLELFSISGGQLTGSIPTLAGVPNLRYFDVDRNQLSGNVPDLSTLTNLEAFSINYNRLEGSLPAPPRSLVDAAPANAYLASAHLCPNRLEGASTPPSIIDLDWNAATNSSPWSADCAPDALVDSVLDVTVSAKNAVAGETVTFTMSVWGNDPSGTITITATPSRPFYPNPVITVCEDVPLADSVAQCEVNNLPANGSDYRINGYYSGDANNASAGDTFYTEANLRVSYAPISVATTSNPAQVGQPVDISASLASGNTGEITTMTFYERDLPVCSSVPVHDVQGHLTARCVTRFNTTGPHSITVETNTDSQFAHASSDPFIQNVVAASSFDANQFALTGAWYNPVTSGQGFSFQTYPNLAGDGVATMIGDWQTFDTTGHANWLVFQGNLSQSHGASYDLLIGQNGGGNFNALPASTATLIGSATLTFHDCTHAALEFSLNDGRSGTIPYVRLAPPSACSNTSPAQPPSPSQWPANYSDVLHSGS
jgi:hypothetical protein